MNGRRLASPDKMREARTVVLTLALIRNLQRKARADVLKARDETPLIRPHRTTGATW
jgi:hypothetical protein